MATVGKAIKCRAAVAWGPNRPLVMEEIEVAPPEAHEIRIKCRECRFCRNPNTNQCDQSWPGKRLEVSSDTTSRLKCRGQTLLQYMGTSTFSEYTVVKEIAVAKIPDSAPLDKACLLGCGVATGYGAALNTAKVANRDGRNQNWVEQHVLTVEPGSTCAVFGLGAVGLAAVMGCKAAGASRIFAVDLNKDKFPKAQALGATDFVNPKDHDKPISQVLAEMTDGGVDFALECVGNVDVMRSALESCVKGWGVSVLTGYNDSQDMSTRCVQFLAGRTLKGSLFGGYKSVDSVPKLVSDVMRGKLQLDEFVTKTLPLDQINKAFDLMANSEGIRTVLTVSML
ncbi:hypothetical protein ANANG_G00096120 [Anguilla anguilla]|uniref:Alcohol dehydrogenase-like C-terminal domain-containing protein n=1 Tax=Anguilla anguilla TaxID=7936 RepID=A0A9D3RYT0_ANGAN|nr:hypothetical protein ANANG_G00096120 [Anguilla anguilla]